MITCNVNRNCRFSEQRSLGDTRQLRKFTDNQTKKKTYTFLDPQIVTKYDETICFFLTAFFSLFVGLVDVKDCQKYFSAFCRFILLQISEIFEKKCEKMKEKGKKILSGTEIQWNEPIESDRFDKNSHTRASDGMRDIRVARQRL